MNLEKNQLTVQYEIKWLWACFFYLSVELVRIQELVPGLSSLSLGVLATVILCLYLINSKQISQAYGFPQIKNTVFFIALLFVFIPFADGPRSAYQAAKGMLLYMPFVFSIVILVNSKERLIQLCRAFGFILFFICSYALLHGGVGPPGTTRDENDLALFVVCFIPLLLFLSRQENKKINKLFWIVAALLSLATIVTTSSRGGFVGLLVMCSIYWFFSKNKIVIALCFICLFGGVFHFAGDKYKNRVATITHTSEGTANERLLSWQAAIDMFLDRPLGVGGDNFGRHFPEYQTDRLERNMWGRAAHSLWFTLISETGVVGIVLYFSIIFFNLKDLFKTRRYKWPSQNDNEHFFKAISLSLLASFFGYFAAGSFVSALYFPIFWYLTALVVCTRKIHSSLISVP